jgi:hypothetical protein
MKRTGALVLGTAVASFLAGTLTSAAVSQGERPPQAQQAPPPPAVAVVNFMKTQPGQDSAANALETGAWKRIHQERVRRGWMRSWALYGRQFPGGTGGDYDYVTVDVYNSFADEERDIVQLARDVLAHADPRQPLDSVLRQTDRARQVARSEVWRLVDHVP